MTNLPAGPSASATDVVASRAAGTGPATWAMGMLFERLVRAEETGGLLGASVVTQPPGQASPLHVHLAGMLSRGLAPVDQRVLALVAEHVTD